MIACSTCMSAVFFKTSSDFARSSSACRLKTSSIGSSEISSTSAGICQDKRGVIREDKTYGMYFPALQKFVVCESQLSATQFQLVSSLLVHDLLRLLLRLAPFLELEFVSPVPVPMQTQG